MAHKVVVGDFGGMYGDAQAYVTMCFVAFTRDGERVYQGRGASKHEALCDLALRLNDTLKTDYDLDSPKFDLV